LEIKDIVVHVDGSPRAAPRIRLGANLAARHGARLIGVFVTPPLIDALQRRFVSVEIPERILKDISASIAEQQREAVAAAEAEFRKLAAETTAAAEWRVQEGYPAGALAVNLRYADLAIVGQTPPDQGGIEAEEAVPEEVLMGGGGPVMVVPHYGSYAKVGERVAIAWDASPTAARAVRDAMPLLATASKVMVLAVNPERSGARHGQVPGSDIALHLARHGVKAETEVSHSEEISVGDMVLSRAFDLGADLIVMGAYGHSRLREVLLGGVTRHVLAHMTCPVMMSH
jgi:nucleotide-binding universal stress UspA family protein